MTTNIATKQQQTDVIYGRVSLEEQVSRLLDPRRNSECTANEQKRTIVRLGMNISRKASRRSETGNIVETAPPSHQIQT